MHSPTEAHFTALKRILRYIKGTLNFGILLKRGSFQLNAFSNSDWAETRSIAAPQQVFVFSFVQVRSPGVLRNKVLSHGLPLKQSSALWLTPLLNSRGCVCFCVIFGYSYLPDL